jgi:hypothetical protein
MRRAAIALGLLAFAVLGCSTVTPTSPAPNTTAGTPSITPSETTEPTASSPTMAAWRVDVINGPRPIEIRFNLAYYQPVSSADWDADAWRVEANAKVTLFDQMTEPHAGSFDLLQTSDNLPILGHCHVFDAVNFQPGSFTIILSGDATGPKYSARIESGQPALLPRASRPDMNDPQAANCSG